MPQLNLAWWLFNFILAWIFVLIVFTILSNKNLNSSNNYFIQPQITHSSTNPWLWN